MLVAVASGCGGKQKSNKKEEANYMVQFSQLKAGEDIAVMKTNMGTIKIRFFPQYAPKAVENFITHSKESYYNGLTFHRVFDEFMIQGGDPLGDGTGGESIWGEPFEDEFSVNLMPYRGALCMANSGSNTNGSQFFIVQNKKMDPDYSTAMRNGGFPEEIIKKFEEVGGTPWLYGKHTVFGQVIEGMEVVDAIAKVSANKEGKPDQAVIIETITIEKAK